MGEPPRVKVHLDESGQVSGLDIEGELDRDNLVEETPGKPEDPPEETYRPERWSWRGI